LISGADEMIDERANADPALEIVAHALRLRAGVYAPRW
jgi:hypothetical protein